MVSRYKYIFFVKTKFHNFLFPFIVWKSLRTWSKSDMNIFRTRLQQLKSCLKNFNSICCHYLSDIPLLIEFTINVVTLTKLGLKDKSEKRMQRRRNVNCFMFVSLLSWFSANCPRAAVNLDFPMNSPIWLI